MTRYFWTIQEAAELVLKPEPLQDTDVFPFLS